MRFFLIAGIIALIFQITQLHNLLAKYSMPLQKFCSDHVPPSQHFDLQNGLVCGINLPMNSLWKPLFVQTGLIHVIVVSGTHFLTFILLLNWIFSKTHLNKMVSNIFLAVVLATYALMTGLQPPAIRSLFTLALGGGNLMILLVSVILSFGFECTWVESLSLILSAYAGLALCWKTGAKGPGSVFEKQAHFFILMMPVLYLFQSINFIQFLANIFIAPVLSFLLFPLALLGILIPYLNTFFLLLADASFFAFNQIQPLIPPSDLPKRDPQWWLLWGIWILIWLFMDYRSRQQARQSWSF